jgi:RNA polymerase sigma factor (sigma-70 family)
MTPECYGKAYAHGYTLTVRFLCSRGVRSEAAQEVAQAAWVRGWERITQLRDDSLVLTWVNTIALNLHRSAIHSASRLAPLPEIADRTPVNLAAIDVERILNLSCPRDRALFRQYLQGATVTEIAETQGVSQNAIRLRFMRARRGVHERLQNVA